MAISRNIAGLNLAVVCVLGFLFSTQAQTAPEQLQTTVTEKTVSGATDSKRLEAERRTFAISLVSSLADEARGFKDPALRPIVIARAADLLWNSDSTLSRTLFRRAWDAAQQGDADELTLKTNDKPPPMVIGLRRLAGRDLRSQVLNLVARRDHQLSEKFLADLKEEIKSQSADSSPQNSSDSWTTSEASLKRLQVARSLLNDGQIDRAIEFAMPALQQVNANSIDFLSALRQSAPETADQRFAFLLARAEVDPSSDANTVLGLSSYAFTPGFYVTFSADGGATWKQGDLVSTAPPNLTPALRSRFFQTASSILLRPLPPPDQDLTSSGPTGKYMAITRLLPLFHQYVPDTAAALRAHLTSLTSQPLRRVVRDDSDLLIQGLQFQKDADVGLEKLQRQLDTAKTVKERDAIYAEMAVSLAGRGDLTAREKADKIDDADRRNEVRRYVDFEIVRLAVTKKEPADIVRLAKSGQLTHAQRAWAFMETAKLLVDPEPQSALEFLEQGVEEARRLEGNSPDRAFLLIGLATQFLKADRVRAWETMDEVVKSANSSEQFTGENVELKFSLLATRSGVKLISFGSADFSLSSVLHALTKYDLYRSVDLARSFKNDAARVSATLAIARAILGK